MDFTIMDKKIDDLEKELNRIFEIVTSEKEITAYKSFLLNTKLTIIGNALENIILSLQQESIINIYNITRSQKFILLFFIIALILMIINPMLGLSINLFAWYLKFNLDKKFNAARQDMKIVEGIGEKAKSLGITIDNCFRFLEARTNYELEAKDEELNDISLKKIELANETIQISLVGDTNIPEELQDMVRKILQEDLKTDEEDIENLLYMAKEKAMNEVLGQIEDKGRIRTKIAENDKK